MSLSYDCIRFFILSGGKVSVNETGKLYKISKIKGIGEQNMFLVMQNFSD